jgi:hypothetical protein
VIKCEAGRFLPMSTAASGPVLVERRKGDRRKVTLQDEADRFVENCRSSGKEVEVQTQREMLSGRIVAENEGAVLMHTVADRDVLLFRPNIVSIAVATSPKRTVP